MNNTNKNNKPLCWVVTEGIAGTENQCLGIAEALGLQPEIKRVKLRQPWKILSPYLRFEKAETFDPPLSPPWPDLLLAGGRKAIAAARYIRKASGGKTFTVFLQDPKSRLSDFDLVIVPEHDSARGNNVFVTAAAPNRVTPQKLAEAKARFPGFENIKSPRVAVLIGGNSRSHTLTLETTMKLAEQLKFLNAGLMITASRRTGENNKVILSNILECHPLPASLRSASLSLQGEGLRERAFIWDGTGDNPYFALLAWADYIIVTSDSVSMLSEAATTGKPVYMIPLEGGSPRLDKLHKNLQKREITRIFEGKLENWTYSPLKDAENAALEIKKRLRQL